MDIGNWVLETADGEKETIPEGTILHPGAYYVYSPPYQWLDNSNEAITLSNSKGEEVDKTPVVSDNENDNRYWMRDNSEWTFGVKELRRERYGVDTLRTWLMVIRLMFPLAFMESRG